MESVGTHLRRSQGRLLDHVPAVRGIKGTRIVETLRSKVGNHVDRALRPRIRQSGTLLCGRRIARLCAIFERQDGMDASTSVRTFLRRRGSELERIRGGYHGRDNGNVDIGQRRGGRVVPGTPTGCVAAVIIFVRKEDARIVPKAQRRTAQEERRRRRTENTHPADDVNSKLHPGIPPRRPGAPSRRTYRIGPVGLVRPGRNGSVPRIRFPRRAGRGRIPTSGVGGVLLLPLYHRRRREEEDVVVSGDDGGASPRPDDRPRTRGRIDRHEVRFAAIVGVVRSYVGLSSGERALRRPVGFVLVVVAVRHASSCRRRDTGSNSGRKREGRGGRDSPLPAAGLRHGILDRAFSPRGVRP
mmetsp:Transcript_37293/g.111702  ORF Transcript_37293/g.111702 Transcript_37293/m.111702 type:complete len:356 (-) Transcript_37293:1084-2151(-)